MTKILVTTGTGFVGVHIGFFFKKVYKLEIVA